MLLNIRNLPSCGWRIFLLEGIERVQIVQQPQNQIFNFLNLNKLHQRDEEASCKVHNWKQCYGPIAFLEEIARSIAVKDECWTKQQHILNIDNI